MVFNTYAKEMQEQGIVTSEPENKPGLAPVVKIVTL